MSLCAFSGTEIVIRDLALGFRAAGHYPIIYSPLLGDLATEIATAGIPVVADLNLVSEQPDIIHGQHWVQTVEALRHFPQTPAIFVCHDRRAWHDAPPYLNRIRRYVAVDDNCRERLTDEAHLPLELVRTIYNAVDLGRFQLRPALPAQPRRALVFSHYAGVNSHLEPIKAACAQVGLPLEVIGLSSGHVVAHPEEILGRYDLVFAKARAAIEAMATGAAVILCDRDGLGGLVQSADVAQLRPWNFGWRLLRQPLEPGRIVQEIQRYDPADAAVVSRYIREQADLRLALAQYAELYAGVMAEWPTGAADSPAETAEFIELALPKIKDLGDEVIRLQSEREHFRGEVLRLQGVTAQLTIEQDQLRTAADRYTALQRSFLIRLIARPAWQMYRRLGAIINRIL